ncbi:hypothetical protein F1880_007559 [Penicillium rolfsii]|nr:hypothetical protein F1880_007559 [Penicillium rolfsii]
MYRQIILIALLAAAVAIQATPLNPFLPSCDVHISGKSASGMTIAQRLEKRSITGDIDARIVARNDEELVGPFDIDGALPVNVGGSIVDI